MVLDDLKERYESFIESLKDKGVPMPEVLVPIVLLLLLSALALLAFPNLLTPAVEKKTLSFAVNDQGGRPVSGARVALYVDGEAFDSAFSGTDGMVSFSGVPATSPLAVNVEASGFESLSKQSISISTPEILLTSSAPATTDVVIKVKDAEGNDIEGANVMLLLDDGNARTKVTDYFGEAVIRLEGAAPEHATLSVEKEGFKKKQASVYSSQLQQMLIVEVESAQDAAKQGAALVSVKSTDGESLSGIIVMLFDSVSNAPLKSSRTDYSGNALFENVAYGASFTISAKDPTDEYLAYGGTEKYSFGKDSGAPFAVVRMERAADGGNMLSVAVTDAGGSRLEGAFVTVFDRGTKTQLAQEQTDALGSARVALAKNKAFYVTAYKDGFLPAYDDQLRAGDSKAFVLEKESAGNYLDVLVTVTQAQQPAPNAYVSLFRGEGFPLGIPAWGTASDGTAYVRVPKQVNGKSYKLYATATLDSAEGKSDIVDVKEGAQLFVVMQYPPAFFAIEPRDVATNESVVNALVSLTAGGKTIATCTSNGSACFFAVAPNEEFTFKASVKGYLDAETASLTLAPGERAYAPLYLYPTGIAKDASLRFEGLFDAKGNAVKEVSNGDSYYARFLATVPSSEFNHSVVFIKVGDKQTIDEEIAAIESFDSSVSDTIYSGASFDSTDCLTSSGNEATSFMKWVQFSLPDGFVGTKEIELKIVVSPAAKSNDSLKILSAMHGFRNGVPFAVPLDSALISSLLAKSYVTDADFCGAKTDKNEIAVTKEPMLCSGSVCVRLYFDVDGKIYRDAPEIELGKTFKLYYDVLALDATANLLTLGAGPNMEIVTWQVAGEASMAAEMRERSTQVSIAPGERASGVITLRALRASDYEPFEFTINFADTGVEPAALQSYAKITGANAFKVLIKPAELIAGLSENVKVTVLDRLDAPVTDATVTFFDCYGEPLNGEELSLVGENARNLGAEGKYVAKIQSASIGLIGVRVQNPAFQTYEECAITSLAGDFVLVQPETLTIEGSSADVRATTKQVILNTLLPVRSSVSADVLCIDEAGNATSADMAGLVYTSPQSFTLTPDSEAAIEVHVKKDATATASCIITFTAKLSPKQKTTATVAVHVDVQGPPPAPCASPFVCLSDAEAIARNCAYIPSMPCASGVKCFSCDVGPQTLPSQIEFAVSNTKPSDTQGFLIALETSPEECRVEGFDASTTSLTAQQYQQNYGTTPQSYYGYQQNQYQPQTNPWQSYSPYSTQPYYNAYAGMSSQAGLTAGASAYGQGYGGSVSYGMPNNCPTTVNPQAMYSGYGSTQYQSPWSQYGAYGQYGTSGYGTTGYGTTGYGTSGYGTSSYGMPQYCQYPYICQNPQLCSYVSAGYGSSMSMMGGSTNYQQLCQQAQTGTATQQTSVPPVKVTIDSCTASDIQLTAKYTGADYFYNGGLSGTQDGFLVIKTGPGQLRRIPVTVTVETPLVSAAASLGTTAPPYSAFPYVSGTMPYNCYFPQMQAQEGTEDLDEYGLPDEITIKYNPVTGKGTYSREIPTWNGLTYQCKKPADTDAKLKSCSPKLVLTYECTPGKEDSCDEDSGTMEMWRTGMQKAKSVSVNVEEDDFRPAVIQLLRNKDTGDSAVYDVDLSDAKKKTVKTKCSGLKVSTKKEALAAEIGKGDSGCLDAGTVQISGYGDDYQIRDIPISVSGGRPPLENGPQKFTWNLKTAPSCSPDRDYAKCAQDSFTVTDKAPVAGEKISIQPGGELGEREKPIEVNVKGSAESTEPAGDGDGNGDGNGDGDGDGDGNGDGAGGSACKLEQSIATDPSTIVGTCGPKPTDFNAVYYKLIGPMAAGECGLVVDRKWAFSGTCKDACEDSESSIALDSAGYDSVPCILKDKKCCTENYKHVCSSLTWKYVTSDSYVACGSGEYCVAGTAPADSASLISAVRLSYPSARGELAYPVEPGKKLLVVVSINPKSEFLPTDKKLRLQYRVRYDGPSEITGDSVSILSDPSSEYDKWAAVDQTYDISNQKIVFFPIDAPADSGKYTVSVVGFSSDKHQIGMPVAWPQYLHVSKSLGRFDDFSKGSRILYEGVEGKRPYAIVVLASSTDSSHQSLEILDGYTINLASSYAWGAAAIGVAIPPTSLFVGHIFTPNTNMVNLWYEVTTGGRTVTYGGGGWLVSEGIGDQSFAGLYLDKQDQEVYWPGWFEYDARVKVKVSEETT